MQNLTPEGRTVVIDLAERFNLEQDTVLQMLLAVNRGGGTMAQFYAPELGGGGQWMRGGMTMVADMFNNQLKATVNRLCIELSNALATTQIFPLAAAAGGSGRWWPDGLGVPFSSGAQNDIRYAVFPQRLAVQRDGQVSVWDTLNHSIGGVSQQQGGGSSLRFSSQFGDVAVESLPLVSGPGLGQTESFVPPPAPPSVNAPMLAPMPAPMLATMPQGSDRLPIDDIVGLIEKLARLRESGALTDAEFQAKKQELLSRI